MQPETVLEIVLFTAVLLALGWLLWTMLGYKKDTNDYSQLRDEVAASSQAAESTAGDTTLMNLDFDVLYARCPDAVGWIECEDVDISYPVVHTDNNDFYLKHAADGTPNNSGSIFLDASNLGLDEPHVLIYGHNMQDGSMFSALLQYRDEAFYRTGTDCFLLYTPDHVFRYQIFSVQVVSGNAACYRVGFSPDTAFDAFLQELRAQSLYETGVSVNSDDKVVTLSTCADGSGDSRMVVSAKRIATVQ